MKAVCANVLIFFLVLTSNDAFGLTGTAQGTVNQVYTYGDGRVLVTGFAFSGATCSNNNAFYIPGGHPHKAQLLAIILSAKATGAKLAVTATIDNCWYPEIAESFGNFIRMYDG